MRISGWHIDGFGTFADFTVGDIPPGLTVFSGPNEAGKSTLLAFIRGMLFGLSGPRSRPAHRPLRGGNHGGRLFLDPGDGTVAAVERYAVNRGAAQVTVDGQPRSDQELRALLGGADADVFRTVFAFGLAELQRMDSLDKGAISERIFSAGVVGAGRSAHAVLKDIEDRKTKLLKQRHGRAKVNDLVQELNATSAQILTASRTIGTHDELGRQIAELDARIARFGGDLEQARATKDRSTRLERLWPTWHERRAALAALAEIVADETLGRLAPDIDELERAIPRFRDWQDDHRRTDANRLAAERALHEQLRDLGPTWDRATLTRFDRSIPRMEEVHRFDEAITEHRAARDAAAADARAAAEVAAAAQRQAVAAAAIVSELSAPLTRAELDQQADTVRALRALNADLAAVESRIVGAAANVTAIERTRPTAAVGDPLSGAAAGYGFGLAAVVLLGLAVWQGLTDGLGIAIVLGVLAVGLAVLAVATLRRAAPRRAALAERDAAQQGYATSLAIAQAEHTGQVARLDELRTAISVAAPLVGLDGRPSNQDIEAADRRHAAHEDDYRVYTQQTRTAAAHADTAQAREQDAAAARARVEAANEAFRAVSASWDAWKIGAGVPPELSPHGILTFFDRVRSGRELLLGLEDAERAVAAAAERIDHFAARARATIAAADHTSTPDAELAEAIQALARSLAADRARRAEQAALQQTIDRCDRTITATLGADDRADTLRAELAHGELERWRADAAGAADTLASVEAERHAAIEIRTTVANTRAEIEGSSNLALLELQRAALIEEIRSAVHEWRVLATAEALVRETLTRFEQDRQPEVLRNASDIFAAVTGGEYVRLYRPLDASAGLSITTRAGGTVQPEHLSQGTREQLYLCIRLGLAADHAARTTSLPLVMDDVLVNFDPDRARAVAEALCAFSQHHQVLLFTCHPHTVDLLRSVQPECRHFAMRRFGGGGEWTADSH